MRNIFLKGSTTSQQTKKKDRKRGGSVMSVREADEILKLEDSLKKKLKNANLRNIYIEEEKEKSFGPVTNELKNIVNAVNEVKEINIKTDEDIHKMLVPLRRPEMLRLPDPIKPTLGPQLTDTPKRPPMSETPKSPMPRDAIILG
ncbi:unnamed protein product [Macrosiphum euphorbiae]|uniref:Uncharacterized protein n=1 Tax=Macrosiphum euphorbiae TaxID=13131 RepID=A0AAV0Y874_9HEMI|nr:unnamed protein product [Macrosiphum euphorbiae]